MDLIFLNNFKGRRASLDNRPARHLMPYVWNFLLLIAGFIQLIISVASAFICGGSLIDKPQSVVTRVSIRQQAKWPPFSTPNFQFICLNGNQYILMPILQNFVSTGTLHNKPGLVQIIPCTKQATSFYLNQWWAALLAHICVTRFRCKILFYENIVLAVRINAFVHWNLCAMF